MECWILDSGNWAVGGTTGCGPPGFCNLYSVFCRRRAEQRWHMGWWSFELLKHRLVQTGNWRSPLPRQCTQPGSTSFSGSTSFACEPLPAVSEKQASERLRRSETLRRSEACSKTRFRGSTACSSTNPIPPQTLRWLETLRWPEACLTARSRNPKLSPAPKIH